MKTGQSIKVFCQDKKGNKKELVGIYIGNLYINEYEHLMKINGIVLYGKEINSENNPKIYLLDKNEFKFSVSRTRLDRKFSDLCRLFVIDYNKKLTILGKELLGHKKIEDILKRECSIIPTGYDKDSTEALFKTLVIKESIFNKLENLKYGDIWEIMLEHIEKGFYNFVVISKKGFLNCQHVSDLDSAEDIYEDGFKTVYRTADLGKGTYTFLPTENGAENVHSFFNHFEEDDEIGILEIEYTGHYLQCILGDFHKDYVVLQEPSNIKITGILYKELDDLLMY